MTVSTSVGRKFTVGTSLRRAAQLAGVLGSGQQLSENDREMFRDFLESIIDELATEGVFARDIEFYNLQLTATVYKYPMPPQYFDIIGNGMYISAGQDVTRASGETLVQQVSRERWHEMSAKNATAQRPTMFWVNRETDVIETWFWPIPSDTETEIGNVVRLPMQRYLSDENDDNSTTDLNTYWSSFLLWELAGWMAEGKSMPDAKVTRLLTKAQDFKKRAKGKANQHGPVQMVVDHPTNYGGHGWRR